MAIPFFTEIERLITEHGSALVLKERLALIQDKLVLLKGEFTNLEQENAKLRQQVSQLTGQVASQVRAQEFEEQRGALFKRRAGGGYQLAAFCPQCKISTAPFPPGAEFCCSTCGWFSSFTEADLKVVMSELP